jgi:hypothetical protein
MKKLDFNTSTKSISRSGYVMKGKTELLTNFNFFYIPMVECCRKNFKVYAIFLSSKLLKLSPQTRFKLFFQKEIPSVPVKHHFSYLSLH